VEEEEEDDNQNNVHVAVRVKPNFNKDKDVWNADPLRGYVGGKLGDFFFGMQICVSGLTVDYVYTGEDTNYSVYEASVKKLVRKTVEVTWMKLGLSRWPLENSLKKSHR